MCPNKTNFNEFYNTFIPMNFENVIYYILYEKKTDIGLKIFEYLKNIFLRNRIPQPVTVMM